VEGMIESYRKAEFDAVVIWEPYFSELDGYKYEFSRVIGDFPCCSMASSLPFYTLKRELLVEFRKEMEKAVRRINKKEMIRALSFVGFNEREIENSLKSYHFSAEIKEKDIKFLENYGIKLVSENVSNLIDRLEF
jgi:predicted transcriptional regulator